MSIWCKARVKILLALSLITPTGFLLKFYDGPGNWWFNNHGAGVLYEIFWIFVILLFAPRRRAVPGIGLFVFLVTCFLECLQLWHPAFLETLRASFLGSVLLGTTFSWWDFPHYALGCGIGWPLALLVLRTRPRKKERAV